MTQAGAIELDIAKQVFQAHGAYPGGPAVFRKRLSRAKYLEFFVGLRRKVRSKPRMAG